MGSHMASPMLCYCHFNGELVQGADQSYEYIGGEVEGFMVTPMMNYNQFLDELCERCKIGRSRLVVKYLAGANNRPPIQMKKDIDYTSFIHFNEREGFVYLSENGSNNLSSESQASHGRQRIIFPPTIEGNSFPLCSDNYPDPNLDYTARAPEYASTTITQKELMLGMWNNEISHVGQVFKCAVKFRNAIEKYCIARCFNWRYVVNNASTYIKVVCTVDGCGCKVFGSLAGDGNCFVVYQFVEEHTHTVVDTFSMKRKVSKSLIGSLFQDKLSVNPHYPPNQMKNDMRHYFDLVVGYKQAWRGKENSKDRIHGKIDQSYVRLPWYCNRIVESNPGSVAFSEMDSLGRFRRCFICMKASIDGFLRGCRRILFIDGTHLKAKFKGTLLAATAPDANNGMFPFAFAIVVGETHDDWGWFLREVRQIVGFHSELVIQSDRHPNIIATVEEVFNKRHHAYCFRHIEVNVLDHIGRKNLSVSDKKLLQTAMWGAAFARLPIDYLRLMDEVKALSAEAHAYLLSSEPEHWATCKFPLRRYDMITTNHAESYNNWIREARGLPILCLIDTIRKKTMQKHMKRRNEQWKCAVGKRIENKLEDAYDRCTKFTFVQSAQHLFEVYGDENIGHRLDMAARTCSCMEWYFSGLPCAHACTVIKRFHYDPTVYVNECYTRDVQDSIYEDPIIPMVTMDMPQIGNPDPYLEPVSEMLPPFPHRGPGRPRKKRLVPRRRRARLLCCSICGEARHNRATCRAKYGPPNAPAILE